MARERNINEILEENVDKIRDRVEENVDKIRDRVEDARERLEDVADKARVKGEEAWKDAVKFTQKHPAQSLGLAMVVGAALGVILFGGRRSD